MIETHHHVSLLPTQTLMLPETGALTTAFLLLRSFEAGLHDCSYQLMFG